MKINEYAASLDGVEIMTVAGVSMDKARENMADVFEQFWPGRKIKDVRLKEVKLVESTVRPKPRSKTAPRRRAKATVTQK